MSSDTVTLPFWVILGVIEFAIVLFIVCIVLFVILRHKNRIMQKKTTIASNKLAARDSLLADYAKRIENLEKFKELYFEIKAKFNAINDLHEQFDSEVKSLLSEEDYETLQKTLEQIKTEKEILEIKLREAEHELDTIISTQGMELPKEVDSETAFSAAERLNEGIQSVKSVISNQTSLIDNLKEQIKSLELEAAQTKALEDTVNSMQEQNNDLSTALEVLQDENQFLQDQIQALLVSSQETDADTSGEIARLKAQLKEQEDKYSELHKKFTSIESEYLQLYEEHKKLKA